MDVPRDSLPFYLLITCNACLTVIQPDAQELAEGTVSRLYVRR